MHIIDIIAAQDREGWEDKELSTRCQPISPNKTAF